MKLVICFSEKSRAVTFDSILRLLEKSGEVAARARFPVHTEGRDKRCKHFQHRSHLNSVSTVNLSRGEWPQTQLLPRTGIISKGDVWLAVHACGSAQVHITEMHIGIKEKGVSRWHYLKLAWEKREYWGEKWVDSTQTPGAGRWLDKILCLSIIGEILELISMQMQSISLLMINLMKPFWQQCTELNLFFIMELTDWP